MSASKPLQDSLTCYCDFPAYIMVLGHPPAYSAGTSLIHLKDQKESGINSNSHIIFGNI